MPLSSLEAFYTRLFETLIPDELDTIQALSIPAPPDETDSKDLFESTASIRESFQAELHLLHEELSTGFSVADREQFVSLGKACLDFPRTATLSIPLVKTLQRLFHGAGLRAFETMVTLMDDKGATWADPAGLPPTVGAQEILQALDRRGGEKKRLLLSHSVQEAVALSQGFLPDYYTTYPPHDTGQWVELALLGVTECFRFKELEQLLLRLQEIEERLFSTVTQHELVPSAGASPLQCYHALLHVVPDVLSEQLLMHETIH